MLVRSIHHNNQPVFGTTRQKTVQDKKIINWQHTDFARQDMDWNKLIDEITSRYPKGANIYCYACSDGSEPYTIALKLIQKLGLEKAKKYPIVAKDIDKQRIDKNKAGIIGLRKTIDIPEIKKCLKNSEIGIDDIIEEANIAPEKVFGAYNYEIKQYRVKGVLKDLVKFEAADIVQDTAKKLPKNSVVLFRNAVPYLTSQQETQLIYNLKSNLTTGSMFVIGGFDKNYSNIGEHLIKSSFNAVDLPNPIVKNGKKLKGTFPLGVSFNDNPLMAGVFVRTPEIKSHQVANILPKCSVTQEQLNEIFSDEKLAQKILDKDWLYAWRDAIKKDKSLCSTGYCYPATEFYYYFVNCNTQPMIIKCNDNIINPDTGRTRKQTHYFLKGSDGRIYDPTKAQYGEEVIEYKKAMKFGFLTEFPSKRACAIAVKLGVISEDFAQEMPEIFRGKKYQKISFDEKLTLLKKALISVK